MFYRLILFLFLSTSLINSQEKTRLNFSMEFFKSMLGDVDIKDADAALRIWVKTYKDKLEKKLGEKITFNYSIHEDYNRIRSKDFYDNCNFLNLPSIEFIKFNQDNRFEPIFTGSSSKSKFDEYLILVHKNSSINAIKDLKKTSLLVPNRKSNDIVEIWLNVLLRSNKMPNIQNCFSKIMESKSNIFSVNSIFFKNYDCAIVSKSSLDVAFELNPQLKKNIRILHSSPPFIKNVMAVRKDLDSEVIKVVVDIGSEIHGDPDGKQIMSLFKIYDIQKITNNDLKNLYDTFRDYNKYFEN